MSDGRDSFVFYKSFLDAIELLPNEEQLEAYRAICRYGIRSEEPNTDSLYTKLTFTQAKPQIDANIKKRQEGKKGGAPLGNTNAKKDSKSEDETKSEDEEDAPF